jgi:ArsR family transcriptional regulator
MHTSTKELLQVARQFHALADETRLRIIECLQNGERCVCELTEELRTGQSRLSFHLKTLKDAGLLIDRREGRWIYYALDPHVIESLQEMVGSLGQRSHQVSRRDSRRAQCGD